MKNKILSEPPPNWISLADLKVFNGWSSDFVARYWLFKAIPVEKIIRVCYSSKQSAYGLLKQDVPKGVLTSSSEPQMGYTIPRLSINLKYNPRGVKPPADYYTIDAFKAKYPNQCGELRQRLITLVLGGYKDCAEYFYVKGKPAIHVNAAVLMPLMNARIENYSALDQPFDLEVLSKPTHVEPEDCETTDLVLHKSFTKTQTSSVTQPISLSNLILTLHLPDQAAKIEIFDRETALQLIQLWIPS